MTNTNLINYGSSHLTCDLPTAQTLIPWITESGVGLSTACARCRWVKATSHWQLVKHPAGNHWSGSWSVAT